MKVLSVIRRYALVVLTVGLCCVSLGSEAVLDRHSGYANDPTSDQGDELPFTYGEAVVESMWTSGRWAYSRHAIFIGNFAGGPFDAQNIDFDITYVCQIRGTNRVDRVWEASVKLLRPYYDSGWAEATWSDRNRRLGVKRDGLDRHRLYLFEAYTILDARDAARVWDSASWEAEHLMMITPF